MCFESPISDHDPRTQYYIAKTRVSNREVDLCLVTCVQFEIEGMSKTWFQKFSTLPLDNHWGVVRGLLTQWTIVQVPWEEIADKRVTIMDPIMLLVLIP